MAKSLRVSYIARGAGTSTYNEISKIGGTMPDDPRQLWNISQPTAVMGIEAGSWEFHIVKDGVEIKIVVAQSSDGHKYLVAEIDLPFENSLLSLPQM